MGNSMSIIPAKKSSQTNEAIKVCIRVRPLLARDKFSDEIVYYPETQDQQL
jgi:hypothetical protein